MSVSYALRCAYASTSLLVLLALPCRAAVSINLPLDDPAYALLDKLVNQGLTFRNALTVKPITRLYAARLLAESLSQRRREWEASKRQDRFLDQTLQHLAGRFKRELREIGAFYQPRRPDAVFWSPFHEIKLDVIAAHKPLLHFHPQRVPRERERGQSANLQGVFSLQEGWAPGDDFTWRLRTVSWGTFRPHLAVYAEPELIVRTSPLLQEDHLDVSLHKGYVKIGHANLELAFGRDTLWWGPAVFGDLALSNNAPPFDMLKISHPLPWRWPGVFRHLGAWHMAAFAAHLGRDHALPHAILSGLRVTVQLTSYLQIGHTHVVQFAGEGSTPNGLATFDVVLSLPFLRTRSFLCLHGAQLYWQHSYNHQPRESGLWAGGNIIGGLIEGAVGMCALNMLKRAPEGKEAA